MTTAQEFKRQMSVGQSRGSTVAQRASETITITRTDYAKKKPKFLLMLGVWFVEENGALRQPTVDELLEHFKGVST
tara:strand:- start:400 stop:627 length:228 start_codon:yes stop_codon:yes gene_type:complete